MARASRAERERLVAEYERSNLTQQAFAEQHGIPVSTLRSWIYRDRAEEVRGPEVPRLLPVHVVASPSPPAQAAPPHVELELRTGITLRIAAGTDARYVAELVAALG